MAVEGLESSQFWDPIWGYDLYRERGKSHTAWTIDGAIHEAISLSR